MDDKLQQFQRQLSEFKRCVDAMNAHSQQQHIYRYTKKELGPTERRIISNLMWMSKILANTPFSDDASTKEAQLNFYLDMLAYGLAFVHGEQRDYKGFYLKNMQFKQTNAQDWLAKSIETLFVIERFLFLSTLSLAATPLLIVTLLPTMFATALNLLSPLLIILPPLAITTLACGALFLTLKVTQQLIRACSKKDVEDNMVNTRSELTKNLYDSSELAKQMDYSQKQAFFIPANQKEKYKHQEASTHKKSIAI